MKRAGLYVRVSTEEQRRHGISVDAQIFALTEYCKRNNFIIIDTYNDAGKTAQKTYKKRPELLRMLSDCQAGKLDIILFTKLDRFFRNVGDYHECIRLMNGVPWSTIWEDYETETASGQLKVNIMLAIAQNEAQTDSERIKSAYDYKRQRGDYIGGKPPIGYRPDGNHRIEKDPAVQEAVEAIFREYINTYSIKKSLAIAYQYGITMRRPAMQRMLKRPCYYGEANNCKCDPYITKAEHDKIIAVMKNRVREPKSKYTYIFAGVFRCAECGSPMAATHTTVKLYRCGNHADHSSDIICKGCCLTEKKAEEYLIDQLDSIVGNYNLYIEQHNNRNDVDSAVKKKNALEQKLKRVGDRYEDGDITRDEYIKKRDDIKTQIAQIKIVPMQKIPDLQGNWKEIYMQLSESEKNVFWKELFPERIRVRKIGKGCKSKVEMML